jgi:1-phosphofructokinase family hexose kinase
VIVCLAANPSVDRLFEVDQLRLGDVHRPSRFAQVAGGKGLNTARAAATLGAEVTVVAILGGHAGRWLEHELQREGLECSLVWVESETRSSLSVADRREGGLTEFYEHGGPVDDADWLRFVAAAERCAESAAWMTVSGSLPVGAPAAGYRLLEPTCAVAVDTIETPPDRADVIKLNAHEAARLTGVNTDDVEGALAAARRLAGTASAAAVTMGPLGAVFVTRDGYALHGTLDRAGAYAVGSGDTFLAGLVVARSGGARWDDALRLALAAATANAAVPGAARFGREDVERLLDRVQISAL